MSIGPISASTFATAAPTSAELLMSPTTSAAGARSKTATLAPPARSSSAAAAPIPLAPPVTSATRPVKSYVFSGQPIRPGRNVATPRRSRIDRTRLDFSAEPFTSAQL
jgi:hypothetical protein